MAHSEKYILGTLSHYFFSHSLLFFKNGDIFKKYMKKHIRKTIRHIKKAVFNL